MSHDSSERGTPGRHADTGCLLGKSAVRRHITGAATSAAELNRVDRTIKKEPAYKGNPKYCLLVFGPKTKTRVWLVLDGDILYVDRNGNGDLSENGKRVPVTSTRKLETFGIAFEQVRTFEVGLTARGAASAQLVVTEFVPKNDLSSVSTENEAVKAHILNNPGMPWLNIAVTLRGGVRQNAGPAFGSRPQDAPLVHFGGRPALRLEDGQALVRDEKPSDLLVLFGTPGSAKDCFAARTYQDIPATAHPIADIEFQGKQAGGQPVRMQVVLNERC